MSAGVVVAAVSAASCTPPPQPGAVQLHVDFADRKTSLSHHGRQISESEPEAQGTATGESQKRDSEERATGFRRQGRAEKEIDDAAKQEPWFVRRIRPA